MGGRAGGRLALAIALMAAVAVGLMSLLPSLPALRWGVAHHWTVASGRWRFRVPQGWRPVAVDGHSGLEEALLLQRARWSWSVRDRPVDEISLREARGTFDAADLAQQWDRRETQMMVPGEQLEPAPATPELRTHYRCSDVKRAYDGTISFGCFERGGRWAIWYRGRREGVDDLVALLGSAVDETVTGQGATGRGETGRGETGR